MQSFDAYRTAELLEPVTIEVDGKAQQVTEQTIPLGPAASQVAIKQLGTNGGGFFNANSAHPFENPTPLSNFLEVLAILLIPAALCYTFGRMIGDRRQGWALLAAMLVIFVPLLLGAFAAEQAGNPQLTTLGVDQAASADQSGGNMEGKETRFGIANSALWATATTAASNGSVNSMHGSFTPLGGLVPIWLMQLGEVVFGGVGSGLYGMLMFAIVAVFLAGLMVGRTPEYLGKKIEAYEVKMAAIALLVPVPRGACGHGDRERYTGRHEQRPESGAARLLRDPVCLLLGRQQQRQRVCQHLGEHALLQRRPRHRDVAVPLLADDPGARDRGKPRGQASNRGDCGNAADARAAVHRHAGRRRADGGCADIPAGARARAHRRASPHDRRRLTPMNAPRKPIVTRPIVIAAIRDSFRKLDPRVQFRNPVMFVVFVGSILTTVIGLAAAGGAMAGAGRPGFVLAVAAWLWLTVLFANFAEAVAEGRGKAQAEALRSMRRHVHARRLAPAQDGRHDLNAYQTVEASALRRGDVIVVQANEIIAGGRRSHRGRRLRQRERRDRRVGAGAARGGRGFLVRDGRHARAFGLDRGARHEPRGRRLP